ncbi:MAG: translation initiation factor IF-2 [Candidatus Diapherotrites archaeon]
MAEIRKPIITVLGHVDHGKTKILDQIRGTVVVDREAGGITQHIGATEVPIETVRRISGPLIKKFGFQISIPGLLFIDTPGHEAFSNLRKRGGNLADLAVLVVDIMQGFQPQTLEAVEILKSYKTPFIVAANKIDLIREWESKEGSVSEGLKRNEGEGERALDVKLYELVGKLHELGFQSERFDRIRDFTKQIPIIPLSAKTKEGLPELLMFLAGLSQKYLENELKIEVSGPGKGTVLEVKEEKGLGKTVDVIIYDGMIKVGDEIVLGGMKGIIRTKVRALLQPKPLDEMRDPQEKFLNVKEVHAAAGIKIAAPNLEDALAGSPLLVASDGKEEEIIQQDIKGIEIESDLIGPIVKADTLGGLEAIVKLLEGKQIKVKHANVGEVGKRDVLEAKAVSEIDKFKGVIFAFNVNVQEIAQQEADRQGVKIFSDKIIYKLMEEHEKWIREQKEEEKKEVLSKLVWPCRMEVLRGFIFRNSKPAIFGVKVLEGRLRAGVKLFNENGIIGTVQVMQCKGENVEEAKAGEEVAISVEEAVVGRDVAEEQTLYTLIPAKMFAELEKFREFFNSSEQSLWDEIRERERKLKEF